ncbi:uncharacterized protein LOC110049773 [Orbicella faveolata]|uniref:uncharacterized protein LOC110049773 n=1 Tax=Orbicella faveolata TaxID=48498 RepID=UPI0009E36F2B|nr:uncharacterized protein LOC110049773 [Orbicella faveolata]
MAKLFVFFLLTSLFKRSLSSASSSVAPKDLGDACQNIWNAAAGSNLRVPSELTVDLAGKNPLFTVEGNGVPKINSLEFIRFRELLQVNNEARQDAFLNVIVQPGGPVEQALIYLKANGLLDAEQDIAAFKNILKELWFQPPKGSEKKGFEHVFIGDMGKLGKSYEGFHNWFMFYQLQNAEPNPISNVVVNSLTYNTQVSIIRNYLNRPFYSYSQCKGIDAQQRIDCGYYSIQRDKCKKVRKCCFDNTVPDVPRCFFGNQVLSNLNYDDNMT